MKPMTAWGVLLVAGALLPGCGSAPPASPAPVACKGWTAKDYAVGPPIRVLRVYTDPRTRDSAIEDSVRKPKSTPLSKTDATIYEYDFGPGSKTQIVVGPANLKIPLKPAPYRESFLLLHGNVTMELGDGTRRELVPGDLTIFEDTDAIKGHGALTGPCGFVSLNIVPPK